MLKVNSNKLREVKSDLKSCDIRVKEQLEQLDSARHSLSRNTEFEEVLIRLNRIEDRMEQLDDNFKSMIRVLDYVCFEYERSENKVVSNSQMVTGTTGKRSRFTEVYLDVPFSKNIGWRK